METCPWHGFNTIDCKPCREDAKVHEKNMIDSGDFGYFILPYLATGYYNSTQAISKKMYKSKQAAQRQADKLCMDPAIINRYPRLLVVRFLRKG